MSFRAAALVATAFAIPVLLLVLSDARTYNLPDALLVAVSLIPSALGLGAWAHNRGLPVFRAVAVFLASFLIFVRVLSEIAELLKVDVPLLVPVAWILVCTGAYLALLTCLGRWIEKARRSGSIRSDRESVAHQRPLRPSAPPGDCWLPGADRARGTTVSGRGDSTDP